MGFINSFMVHRGLEIPVLVAWNILFSLFPIILGITTIAGVILAQLDISQSMVQAGILHLVPASAGSSQLAEALAGAQQHSGLFGVIAFVGFLWAAFNLFGSLEDAFGNIFELPARGFLQRQLMSLVMMLLFVVLVTMGVLGSTLGESVDRFLFGVSGIFWGIISGFILFFSIYWVVPNRRFRFREIWLGALAAGVGFELLTQLFPLYIYLNHGMNQYGATFAFLFILLTFLYFFGVLVVLGAELNLAWIRRRGAKTGS